MRINRRMQNTAQWAPLLLALTVILTGKSWGFSTSHRHLTSKRGHSNRRPSSLSSGQSFDQSSGQSSGQPPDQRRQEAEDGLLLPEADPHSDPHATSLSGVPYAAVVAGIDALYPPRELSARNAKSRTDGYWKYVARGVTPPQEFTYGEFDVDFFGRLLDRAWEHRAAGADADEDAAARAHGTATDAVPWRNRTFCDIGSGTGRLVLTAAALHPGWAACRGLEILEGLHGLATRVAEGCRVDDAEERRRLGVTDAALQRVLRVPRDGAGEAPSHGADAPPATYLPLAPVDLRCGSFADPYEYLGDVDCAFVFSSCMAPELVRELSDAIGRQCRPGTIVITTEFPLCRHGRVDPVADDAALPHGPYALRLLERIDGWCWLLGGKSTAYVHRVEASLWEGYFGPRARPRRSLEEEARRLVRSLEDGELTDAREFVRRVRNDMVFHGLPPEFLPDIEDGD